MSDYILETRNLTKKFKNQTAVSNVSLAIRRNTIFGLLGPNGSGKTTTIKLIMNLLKRDSGTVEIFGKDNIKHEREVKDRIGFVYDESHFYEDLTIKQMKNIVAPFYTEWNEEVFQKYIRDFSLDEKMKIKSLSKGMKMKFSLSLALSHNAELIIMDEPTSGVDPVFRREMLDILYDIIQDEKKSIFFSTHITTDLEKIADYITFINNGEIVFSQTKDEVLESYGIVKGGNELLNTQTRTEFIGIRETNVGFEALSKDIDKIRRIFKDKVIIEKASLEDIMFYTVRR